MERQMMFKDLFRVIKEKKFLILVFGVPIIINYLLLTWHFPGVQGNYNDWLGFFSNYSGGIIGAIGAYFVAIHQIKKQKEIDDVNDTESNRSLIILEEFSARPDLHNVITHSDSKLLRSYGYDEIKEVYKDKHIPFYRIKHVGKPELILNCKIEIVFDDKKHKDKPIEVFNLHALEKGIEVFIPLMLTENNKASYPKTVKISYLTICKEKILFEYNIDEKFERHLLINEKKDKPTELHNITIEKEDWILPAKLKKSIDVKITNKTFI
jgi:hypothetical protein